MGDQLIISREPIRDFTVGVGDAENDPVLKPMHILKQRKESYTKFHIGEGVGDLCYRNWDVAKIAHRYLDLCNGIELSSPGQDSSR